MSIDLTRFCINRKIAPTLSIKEFFQLVQRIGLNKVELRNDMWSGKVCDDLTYKQMQDLITKYNIEVITINALYPFNRVDESVLKKAEGLLQDAKAINAKALVMCPLNEGVDITAEETLASIKTLEICFAQYGVNGLVEPLGFPTSSMRSAVKTQQLINEAHSSFKLVIDTFHHHIYDNAEQNFSTAIDVNVIGLVHISGVEDTRATAKLTDEERVMLSNRDVLNSVAQIKRLEVLGYKGIYAFEPFSSQLNSWKAVEIERQINHSIHLLQA
ncbi:TIM barrel protein [Pantoea sp. Nvir]|uniref:TIM barrel protein n=1 Tax=Pantoea sp. Nvir TaxID=2576760 RepID=UPI001359F504|nr:TIM barrel protein [Pantoea sp. Nvir]MXP66949.1 TIM barrel protein [Pantoea sp. Nvir]CAJ0992465.1 Inosose isomerase [Pantoea sp. Nvir]